jgi:RNA polymerase sigma factor (sigma-70 family)
VTTQSQATLSIATAPDEPARSTTEVLLDAALGGDGHAFSQLVKPHLKLLYGIAHRACGDSAMAEDAVQETLLLGYRRLGRLREPSVLRAFLAGIATRRARTLLRGAKRRTARELSSAEPSRADRADEVLDASRLAARIRLALAGLPAKRQEVVMLRLEGKMSDGEIAQALGSSEGSVRVLAHLGMKQLRATLQRGGVPL